MNISIFSFISAIVAGIATPAFAWSNSAHTGAYRATATMANDAGPLSLAVASSDPRPATVHAWFVDSEGMILGEAALGAHKGGQLLAYNPAVKVPAYAVALVVLTQPGAARAGGPDAQVMQISLPAQ
jgi:hypothetical protein